MPSDDSCCWWWKSTSHSGTFLHVKIKNLTCCLRMSALYLLVWLFLCHQDGIGTLLEIGKCGSNRYSSCFLRLQKNPTGVRGSPHGKNFLIERAFVINQNTWSLEKVKRTMCQRIGNLCWSTEKNCCIVVARRHLANSGKSLLLCH